MMKKTLSILLFVIMFTASFSALAEGSVQPVQRESQTYTGNDMGGLSANQALQGYIDRVFGISSGIVPKAAPRRSLLQGNDLKVYDYLVVEIQKIASGERKTTAIEIPYESFLDQPYDASELGVDYIVQDGKFTAEALESFYEKTDVDISAINAALLADFPYDLYWYDKTAETQSISQNITADYIDGAWYMHYVEDGLELTFPVAKEFSASNEAGTSAMNPALPSAIQTAKQNVEAIVEDYQTKSDIDKLTAYKKEICDRVEYNDPAAAGGIAYGNPWQLIWVFDDDPATTVVCEGYSKAFKYLCDLSEFQTKLTVSLMSGDMWVDDEEAGPHMWNLVAMGNGKNYLVDVTNCDGNSIGAPDLLFMKGYTVHPDSRTYGYDVGHGTMVYYYYDDGTLSLYSAEELAAHGEAFDPASYPAANLYGYTLTIPEDTVYIDSQAFADLGEPVNILIRRSDVTIADDAFSGSEVILIGPDGLREWAESQGIPFVSIADLPE